MTRCCPNPLARARAAADAETKPFEHAAFQSQMKVGKPHRASCHFYEHLFLNSNATVTHTDAHRDAQRSKITRSFRSSVRATRRDARPPATRRDPRPFRVRLRASRGRPVFAVTPRESLANSYLFFTTDARPRGGRYRNRAREPGRRPVHARGANPLTQRTLAREHRRANTRRSPRVDQRLNEQRN